MNRIERCFAAGERSGIARFVCYVCAGDPDPATSFDVCRTLIEEGCDILELGVPFSDPLADGLTNQLAAERALNAGMTQERVFQLVRDLRAVADIPLVFYTYYNMVFACGIDDYAARAAAAGLDAVLILDLPPEEAADWQAACTKHGLATVFIVAPTTPESRLSVIAKATTGFIYYVSREGVTGERDSMAGDLPEKLAAIRRHCALPVAVGFGVSRADHMRAVARVADGVIVGSALVNCIAQHLGDPPAILAALRAKMQDLRSGLGGSR
jgi:tryptophan synthase alpha chain